ncbi:hypothetical protein J7S19_01810 [Corynebacterium pyruviciproducens]|uniref:hypothetical protein n=1 Tax=Corynebacterium pyruviciproducens TaxID=598660 RepID=UPI002458D809|nr:hypothetical protein [Corynebacterium pyruviciproducens]MDH4657363.1 hypothetical protein [Corynebacterium pyruviciproducens]
MALIARFGPPIRLDFTQGSNYWQNAIVDSVPTGDIFGRLPPGRYKFIVTAQAAAPAEHIRVQGGKDHNLTSSTIVFTETAGENGLTVSNGLGPCTVMCYPA